MHPAKLLLASSSWPCRGQLGAGFLGTLAILRQGAGKQHVSCLPLRCITDKDHLGSGSSVGYRSSTTTTCTSATSTCTNTRSCVSISVGSCITCHKKLPRSYRGHRHVRTLAHPANKEPLEPDSSSTADGKVVSGGSTPPAVRPRKPRGSRKVADELATASASSATGSTNSAPVTKKPQAPRKSAESAVLSERDPAGVGSSSPPASYGRMTSVPEVQGMKLQPGPSPGGAWDEPTQWVVFSDLHVCEKTLPTCLKVLSKVHDEAVRLHAGIIFLGDFWDERAFIPVEPLNAVMGALSKWTRPMLMLVGNHDQVDLGGCEHALSPLEAAWPDRIHVFTEPSLYREALWLPYRRDQDQLRQALRMGAEQGVRAVMAHADVQTARFNYQAQSREGVPPDLFPQGLPVYTGHYHLPHTVANTNITYVGSPYQVTASESGESKHLLVLDALTGWQTTETIPIDVGPRHLRLNSSKEVEALWNSLSPAMSSGSLRDIASNLSDSEGPLLRAGDRVKLSLLDGEADNATEVQRELRKLGVSVELSLRPATTQPRMGAAEDRPVLEMLAEYGTSVGMSKEGLELASGALRAQMEKGGMSTKGQGGVDISFTKVHLEGYGPFREKQTYPLSGQGLRVVSGSNRDDVGSDSNGAGKTCLICSPLWALTGGMMARSESAGGRQVVDLMLNEGSKEGKVVVEGVVNGQQFTVERVIKRGKTSKLLFALDGKDATQADISRTQERIRDALSTDLLSSTVFFGQNDVAKILEADDASFKELLGRVVEMKIWEDARVLLVPEMSKVREDVKRAEAQVDLLERQVSEKEEALKKALQDQLAWDQKEEANMTSLRNQMDRCRSQLASLLSELVREESILGRLHRELHIASVDAEAAAKALEPTMGDSLEGDPALSSRYAAAPQAATVAEEEEAKALAAAFEEQRKVQAAEWDVELSKREVEDKELQQLREKAAEVLRERQGAVDQLIAQVQDKVAEVASHAATEKGISERIKKYRSGLIVEGNMVTLEGRGAYSHTHKHSSEADQKVRLEDPGSGGKGGTSLFGTSGVKPVCEQCLQEIDEEKFLMNLTAMEEELEDARLLRIESRKEEEELRERLSEGKDAVAQAEKACKEQRSVQEALAEKRQRADKASAEASHAKAARISAERERVLRERQREAEEKLQAAMLEQRREAEVARKEREKMMHQWQQAVKEARALSQLSQSASTALESLSKARGRWSKDAHYKEGVAESGCIANVPPHAAADDRASLTTESVAAACERVTELIDRCDQLLRQLVVEASQISSRLAAVNPHTSEVSVLEKDVASLTLHWDDTELKKSELVEKQAAYKEADKALGRGGIRSFVLEGVLGELQARTSTYLETLSGTMSLELMSSKPLNSKKGGKATRYRSKRKASSADDEGTATDSDDELAEGATASATASKEEIMKVVKVRLHGSKVSADAYTERSLNQLSGGERRRLALALSLGFVDLARQRGRMSCNLLVLDEILQHLDGEGCGRVADVLRQLPQDSVLVVGQAHSFVTSIFDVIDTVVKENGTSKVYLSA